MDGMDEDSREKVHGWVFMVALVIVATAIFVVGFNAEYGDINKYAFGPKGVMLRLESTCAASCAKINAETEGWDRNSCYCLDASGCRTVFDCPDAASRHMPWRRPRTVGICTGVSSP